MEYKTVLMETYDGNWVITIDTMFMTLYLNHGQNVRGYLKIGEVQYNRTLVRYGAKHNMSINEWVFKDKSQAEEALEWVRTIEMVNMLGGN